MENMEFQDHNYTNTTYDKVTPMEFTYKSKYKQQEMSCVNAN